MARDTGKALDNVLDWANEYKGKIALVLSQIELYREGPLTANELLMLSTFERLLTEESNG